MQMRAGTQTLIQALQALPWSRLENDEDIPDTNHSDSSEDEEDQLGQRKLDS
jgi:sterol 3beta-glucosyltransferase